MNLKDVNRFFGYTYFAVGAAKIIFLMIIGIKILSMFNSSNNIDNFDTSAYGGFGLILGFVQLGLAMTSVLMIIINIKKQPNVILGYVLGIIAALIEISISGIFSVFLIIPECYLYMEAGKKITKACSTPDSIFKY